LQELGKELAGLRTDLQEAKDDLAEERVSVRTYSICEVQTQTERVSILSLRC
jgi:hypothetical protein